MQQFHVHIHPGPSEQTSSSLVQIDGQSVRALDGASDIIAQKAFRVSFERVSERMLKLPHLLLEPDGWFLWKGENRGSLWQLQGNLYDRDGRLAYVEVKGTCEIEPFRDLVEILAEPDAMPVFQLARHGVFVTWEVFQKLSWDG